MAPLANSCRLHGLLSDAAAPVPIHPAELNLRLPATLHTHKDAAISRLGLVSWHRGSPGVYFQE